jgi:hypothetical protein
MCKEEREMAVINTGGGGMVITGEHVDIYRLITIRHGLKIEAMGMRLTGKAPSCLSIVKREFGFKGNREKVTAQFDTMLRERGIIK